MSILERHLEEEPRSHSDQKKRKETPTLPQIIRMKSEKKKSTEAKEQKGRRPPSPASTHRTTGKGHRGQAVRRRRAHRKGNARPAKGLATAPLASALLVLLRRERRLQVGERGKGKEEGCLAVVRVAGGAPAAGDSGSSQPPPRVRETESGERARVRVQLGFGSRGRQVVLFGRNDRGSVRSPSDGQELTGGRVV
jgi:hypothetical protein